ncbi:MAG: hypothetical protein U5Q03_00540 [Bacteroidota bacterium]|nr:hypothetical protein [Bacteroidota bacterium]
MKKIFFVFGLIVLIAKAVFAQVDTLMTNAGLDGQKIMLVFEKGKEHNHPLMAVWIEDLDSNYVETLYVAKSIGTSVFNYGDKSSGQWKPGVIRRPAALPYWVHKRGIEAEDGLYLPSVYHPVADAITGPTPKSDFVLLAGTEKELPEKFRVLFEINQSWDWNEYWSNTKFPDEPEYRASSQPSIIYEAVIDMNDGTNEYFMEAIGHGHYSGKDGQLYTDLSTLTTAKEIAGRIVLVLE